MGRSAAVVGRELHASESSRTSLVLLPDLGLRLWLYGFVHASKVRLLDCSACSLLTMPRPACEPDWSGGSCLAFHELSREKHCCTCGRCAPSHRRVSAPLCSVRCGTAGPPRDDFKSLENACLCAHPQHETALSTMRAAQWFERWHYAICASVYGRRQMQWLTSSWQTLYPCSRTPSQSSPGLLS